MADGVDSNFEIDRSALEAQLRPFLTREMARVTRRIATLGRVKVPVRTGNLGRSIVEDPITFVGPFRAESGVTATAPYAAAVHNGTRPHVIRARAGGYLAFPGAGGGTVFAKSVNHPGTKARPFLKDAADEVLREL